MIFVSVIQHRGKFCPAGHPYAPESGLYNWAAKTDRGQRFGMDPVSRHGSSPSGYGKIRLARARVFATRTASEVVAAI